MKQQLDQRSVQQVSSETQLQSQHRNFGEAEEVIGADREQTKVPDALVEKLAGTLAAEPPPPGARPWWKRLLG